MTAPVLVLPVPPSSNGRLRPGRNRRGGLQFYNTTPYRLWLEGAQLLVMGARLRRFDAPAEVTVRIVWHRATRRGDLDNIAKPTLDVLRGLAFRDDAQVAELHLVRLLDRRRPRLEVTVTRGRCRMTADLAAGLRALAEALPAGTAVPVPREMLLELLAGRAGAVPTSATPPADLTVADLCARFGRGKSAVRAWLEAGRFAGAYKLMGRDWRVPAASADQFQVDQVAGAGAKTPAADVGDLGAWRRERGRA